MQQRFACKFCIALDGLKGSAIDQLPASWEAIAQHVEKTHGYPVTRENETR